jgi:hypothetical protein
MDRQVRRNLIMAKEAFFLRRNLIMAKEAFFQRPQKEGS